MQSGRQQPSSTSASIGQAMRIRPHFEQCLTGGSDAPTHDEKPCACLLLR